MISDADVELRGLEAGDLGWIVHRHGVLYHAEYGWGERFEALVAEIASSIVLHFDASRERAWVATRRSEFLGCVFLVKHTDEIAKIRLLLVEPAARGLGLGTRLVAETLTFARARGYRKVTLWTHAELKAAGRIYAKAGFELTKEESHADWGVPVVGQTWEISLV